VWNLSQLPSRQPKPRHVLSEDELADAWEQRAYAARYLVDCCGRHLRVVFPGRRWGGPGPDFVGAVLAELDGTLVRGDVEVHPRASSWAAHGHASDAAYQHVVLHVVQEADVLAVDARGVHLPTVELEPEPGRSPPRRERAPCVREAPSVLQIVEAAGTERFRARVARFEGDLSVVDADQALWRGVCEALGFRRNTVTFGQLADAVPWSQAALVVADRGPVGLAGLLLGTAGLIAEATLPEAHAWRTLQRTLGLRAALPAAGWDRRQLRAANAPEQRCRGLAELAARWAHAGGRPTAPAWHGPADQVLKAVSDAAAGGRRPALWRLLRASPWIGRGRAQVIAVNVLLPFAAAAGVAEAWRLFECFPGEPSNRVVRYMAQQLGGPAVRFKGARQQQGLLHLFKLTCAGRICERCPARAGPAKRNIPGRADV
jgi:Protein of unknown function (DUF2851)